MHYIIHNGFDERHAYIGGMFGAGESNKFNSCKFSAIYHNKMDSLLM